MCADLIGKLIKVGEWKTRLGISHVVSAPSFRHLVHGVPTSGPFDQCSAGLSNALIGNAPELPTIELCPGRFQIFIHSATSAALVGADIVGAIDGRLITPQSSFHLEAGQLLEIDAGISGTRCYLALPGGVSQFDNFLLANERRTLPPRSLGTPPRSLTKSLIRYVPFKGSIDLSGESFTITTRSDRTGLRLAPAIEPHLMNLLSEPATPGVIQHTPSGELIVLGPDGPTIGGYPKLGTVLRCDLDHLAQLRPLEFVRFSALSREDAVSSSKRTKSADERLIAAISIDFDQRSVSSPD